MHGVPSNLAAGSRELLDRIEKRPRLGADGAVLYVNNEQGRSRTKSSTAAEAGSAIGFLLVLRNDGVPRFHGGDPRLVAIACFKSVVVVLCNGALTLIERSETLAHLIERSSTLE